MPQNKQVFTSIKIGGMLLYIPVILATGPLTGYLAGDFLVKKFHWGQAVLLSCIGIGFITSVVEIVRIIRLVSRIEKQSSHQ
jgi:hypothetical protein